jgi:hypothetical protein
MDLALEVLKLRVEIAKLKLAVELPNGKSLNPAYREAEAELNQAERDLSAYQGALEL